MGVYGSFEHMTKEQLSEAGKKGGKASVEARRRRKELKETLEILLNMSLDKRRKNVDIEKIQAFADLKGKNVTVDEAMMIKLVQKALSGDLNSISMVRDTIGEKPSDRVEVKDVTPIIITTYYVFDLFRVLMFLLSFKI